MILEAYNACSRSLELQAIRDFSDSIVRYRLNEADITHSMNCCLSPLKGSRSGPDKALEARIRSSLTADKHRAKTASPIKVTGVPKSKALMAVHFPVPFCPAASRILVTMGSPSSSLNRRISRVISIKKESRTPEFHCFWTENVPQQ